MTQLQAQIPDPLRNALPALLPTAGLTAPAIRVLFSILIGKSRLKGATMEVQFHHVRSRETLLGQAAEEEFVDDAFPRNANPALLFGSLVSCDDDAAMNAFRPYRHIWAVVETTHDQAFRTMQ